MRRPQGSRFENSKLTAIKHVFGTSILGFLKACYPILIFYGIHLLVRLVLDAIPYPIMEAVKEAVGSLVVLGYLIPVLRRDILMQERVTLYRPKEKEEKKQMWIRWLYAAVTITMIAVAANNILGFTPLEELTTGYSGVKDSFLAGPLVVQLICLGFVIPYAEELLFRGIIYGRAKEAFGPQKGIVISALLFGIVHWNLVQLIYATFVGLVLAFFVERYRSLVPAFLGHMASNIIVVLHEACVETYGHFPLFHLAATVVCIVLSGVLFGIQFRDKRLRRG